MQYDRRDRNTRLGGQRAFDRFQRDRITDHAAALTYYSLLSLFPALLFGVAILGVFGQQALIHSDLFYEAEWQYRQTGKINMAAGGDATKSNDKVAGLDEGEASSGGNGASQSRYSCSAGAGLADPAMSWIL